MTVKAAVEERSAQARSGRGERGRRGRGGAVGGVDAGALFYRVRGGAGRPFQKGIDRGVMRVGGCSGRYGSGRGAPGGGSAHVSQRRRCHGRAARGGR
jgi:hypothetical protein